MSARHEGQVLACRASTVGETPYPRRVPTCSWATVAGETFSPDADTPSGAQADRDHLSGKVRISARLNQPGAQRNPAGRPGSIGCQVSAERR